MAFGDRREAIRNARDLIVRGDFRSAIEQAREIVDKDPEYAAGHRLMGIALRRSGSHAEADVADLRAIEGALLSPALFQAVMAIAENRLDAAEEFIRQSLADDPEDAAALRLLAEIAARTGNTEQASRLLDRVKAIAPHYPKAEELRRSLAEIGDGARLPGPGDSGEQYAEVLRLYEIMLDRHPGDALARVDYGYVLRAVGRRDEAIAAYREAIRTRPQSGPAWWALADLKLRVLTDEDVATMEAQLRSADLHEEERTQLHFALGRALEQAGDHEAAFAHYSEGNLLRRAEAPHDREAVTRFVDQCITLFDPAFFEARRGAGAEADDPIFILGMPRAGSTLIEQILASHPLVEGTSELPNMSSIARWLAGDREAGIEDSPYLDRLSALGQHELRKLGEGYLWGTRLRRQTDRPHFTDKMPNNWLHVGMILTVLPNARIIDARRHPLSCGISLFRQHFSKGQKFSYDLGDIGSFYANYVRLMRHFDRVMPGRIVRVIHEELVSDPDRGVRELLDRLALPFDPACLRPHENRRAVRTASSEQVRQPISADAIEGWRPFEPWLGPLKDSLGRIVDRYPSAP